MNEKMIYICISISIIIFSLIIICASPIINDIQVKSNGNTWKPSSWRTLNCGYFSDKLKEKDLIDIDDIQKLKKVKGVCYRQKAMYGLEHSSLVINIIIGFICGQLSLLHYFGVGADFQRKTGLIGIIGGGIGFILTFFYTCYSGYIFTNDYAYSIVDYNKPYLNIGIQKLYSNGATYKIVKNTPIHIYNNDKDYDSQYIKFYELGQSQYNYNKEYFELYEKNKNSGTSPKCIINDYNNNCDYVFDQPEDSIENKYIHDRWLTSLILSVFLFLSDAGLIVFGIFLLNYEQKPEGGNDVNTVNIHHTD